MMDEMQRRLKNLPGHQEVLLPQAMLNAYLDNDLDANERALVEEEIGRNETYRELYEKKLLEKASLLKKIPHASPTPEALKNMTAELHDIVTIALVEKPANVLQKVWKFLDTPII